jgi:aspartyl-tRNA(Asn)/glutamyl-tRNA(Gln) amidotransferase subunit B
MELGSLFKDMPWDPTRVPAPFLASVIAGVRRKHITSPSAKRMLALKFEGDERSPRTMIVEEDLALTPLSQEEYEALAKGVLEEKPDMVRDIKEKGQVGKVGWFVGQMISRSREGSVEPDRAKIVLMRVLGLEEKEW